MKSTLRCTALRATLPAMALLFASGGAVADKLTMPEGMGGVPDIGAIPCKVFTEMTVVAPLGTRHSLLTWTAGYLQAISGKSLQEVVNAAKGTPAGGDWTYDRIAMELAAYCTSNPKAVTSEAARDLGRKLGVVAP